MKQPLAFTIGLNATKALRKTLDGISAVEQAVEAPIGRAADAALRDRVACETGMTLTTDSMSQHAPIWMRLLAAFAGQPDLRVLEIGSFEGCSALWLLEHIASHSTATVTCIDSFFRLGGEPLFDHNMQASGHAERVVKLKGRSEEVLPTLALASYDIIFIDGSHRACDVLMDAVASWPLLKTGGVLIFDDYQWQPELPPARRPQLAIDLFLTAFAGRVELMHQDVQVFLRKTLEVER